MAGIDRTPPRLTSISMPSAIDISAGTLSVTATVGATDDASGVTSVGLYFDKMWKTPNGAGGGALYFSNSIDDFSDGTSTNSFLFDAATELGVYTIVHASVIDANLNYTTYSGAQLAALGFPISITVTKGRPDTTPPEVVITSPNLVTNAARQTISGTLAHFDADRTVTLYDGSTIVGSVVAGVLDGSWSRTIMLSGEGKHTITARATDNAGNVGISRPVSLVLDTAPPTVTIANKDGFVHSGSVVVSGAASASEAGRTVVLSTGQTAIVQNDGTWSTTASLSEGVTAIVATLTDAAGNQGRSAKLSLTLDTIPPHLSVDPFPTLTARDHVPLSGISDLGGAAITIREDGHVVGHATWGDDQRWTATVSLDTPGPHRFLVTATDPAGNVSEPAEVTIERDLSPERHSFGTVTYDARSAGGQVYALYDGLLGRAPDVLGLEFWADAFADGVAPRALAAGFLASAEGQARAGAADDATFVTQLYNATLHRNPDAPGLSYWTDQLAHGTSRAEVGVGFALSSEHLANIQPALDAGLFVPDADASAVARIYYTMLSRAPDAAGLKFWTDAIKAGTPLTAETQSFLDSPEAQAKVAGLTTAQYVDLVYTNALGRHAEPEGLAFWSNGIDGHAASRVDVTTAIGQSPEAQAHLAPLIEQGWHLA